jgi:hypothetical protein
MVEEWMEDHDVALENGVRYEIMESFMDGLKELFEAHHIDIPEDKVNVLDEMQSSIDDLNKQLDEKHDLTVDLNNELNKFKAAKIVAEAADGMSDLDKDKFLELTEDLSYETGESFIKKVNTIRENYFNKKTGNKKVVESIVSDIEVLTEEASSYVDPSMRAYISVLNKSNS